MELRYENLIDTLYVANESERSSRQGEAESQLKKWETQSGYHYLLQEIYLRIDLPLQIRWLAVICFKNGIEKYWRPSRPNAMGKDEKDKIRRRIFQLLSEQNNQLTIQNAQAIARIARFDFPSEFPGLFDDLSKILEEHILNKRDVIAVNNLLIILNQIIKTLASIRIGRARHAMQSKSPILVSILVCAYLMYFKEWTNNIDLTIMEICYLCLKNLRRIIPEGFEQPHKSSSVVEFIRLSVDHLRLLVMEHERFSSDLLERYVKCYGKLYFNLLSNNPTSFVLLPSSKDIISTFLELLQSKAETVYFNTEENDFWETLALKGFLILKKAIAYIYKRGAIVVKERNNREEVNSALSKLTNEVFTQEAIELLCDLIIDWYLKLKPSDLESWSLEPEEWTNEELSTSWEYQVRPCAENFFQDLVSYLRQSISNFIISKISPGWGSISTLGDILRIDSTLCTFQLSAVSIAESVDFDAFLSKVLVSESLRGDMIDLKILRRRTCLVVGEWVSVSCSAESRKLIYKLLVYFLNYQDNLNDKVVMLTAVQTLRKMVDDWDFDKRDFVPFLSDLVASLLRLLNESSFTESKLYILNTLSAVIEKTNPQIDTGILFKILEVVPIIWNVDSVGGGEPILRNSALRLLRQLLIALNEESYLTYTLTIPLIRMCCSEESESYALLSEDGYDLWLALVQYHPFHEGVASEVIQLYDLLPYGMMNSTEILTCLLAILRSYTLLAGDIFGNETTLKIFRILSGYLPNMRDDAFGVFVTLLDILFLSRWDDERVIENLYGSGLLNGLINFVLDDAMPIVSANKILVVLARLASNNSQLFLDTLALLSIDRTRFFDVWLKYYNNNGSPKNKKMNLLAFLSLASQTIPKHDPFWTANISKILRFCFLFLEEVQEDTQGGCSIYNQDFIYEDINDYNYLDPDIKPHGEKLRYQYLLDERDQIFKVNLQEYVKSFLVKLKNEISESDFQSLITLSDDYTIERLYALV